MIQNTWVAAGLGLLSFFVVIVIEAIILKLFRLNPFGRCLRDSFMANIGSLLLCVLLFLILNKVEFEGITEFTEFCILFLISSFFESWIIKLMNKDLAWSRIIGASLVMNLITFGASYWAFATYMY